MILTGEEIKKKVENGLIEISPFNKTNVGPNSYNLALQPVLKVYKNHELDSRVNNPFYEVEIPEDGLVLRPGTLYLGSTAERTYSPEHVPMIEGRSSIARLGMLIHVSAGFGDIGYNGHWTLEITVVHPLRIYPGMKVCQVYFHQPVGEVVPYYGKYQNSVYPGTSEIWRELN